MLKSFIQRRRKPEDPHAQVRAAVEAMRSEFEEMKAQAEQNHVPRAEPDPRIQQSESAVQYGVRLLGHAVKLRRALGDLDDHIYDVLVGGHVPDEGDKTDDAGIMVDYLLDCTLRIAYESGLSIEQRLQEAHARHPEYASWECWE